MRTFQIRRNRSRVVALFLAVAVVVALSVVLATQIRSNSFAANTGSDIQPAGFEVHYGSITDEELLAAGVPVSPVRYDFGFPSGLDEELLAGR